MLPGSPNQIPFFLKKGAWPPGCLQADPWFARSEPPSGIKTKKPRPGCGEGVPRRRLDTKGVPGGRLAEGVPEGRRLRLLCLASRPFQPENAPVSAICVTTCLKADPKQRSLARFSPQLCWLQNRQVPWGSNPSPNSNPSIPTWTSGNKIFLPISEERGSEGGEGAASLWWPPQVQGSKV